MAVNTSVFENELNTNLAIDLAANGETVDANVLAVKVNSVVKELLFIKNYAATSMTDAQIEADIERYYPQCMSVARYDYNMIGAEGETQHSENGISRHYVDRQKLWSGVIPFAKVGGYENA